MSGQQIGTVVGGIIGSFVPVIGTQLGMAIGGMIGGAIDPEVIKAPGIGDAQSQTTAAGVPRPVVFGHPAPFMGNIIDGEHKARKITVEEGGKGGPVVEQERFLLTSAIRICEGPIAGVARIWRNGDVVADFRADGDFPEYADATSAERSKYIGEIRAKTIAFMRQTRIYLGDEYQLPDPALETIHGIGNTPYYRGTCYMVREDDDVTDTRGACAQYQFEVIGVGTEASVVEVIPGAAMTQGPSTGGNFAAREDSYSDFSPLPLSSSIVQLKVEPGDNAGGRCVFTNTDTGELIWDSGWVIALGSTLANVNDSLIEAARPDLIENSVSGIGLLTRTEFFDTQPSDITIQSYAANGDAANGCSVEWSISVLSYIPDYTRTPELPGALIGSDGIIYYPWWESAEELDSITDSGMTLASVVSDIADRCGVPASNIDTTALTDIIPGFLVAVQSTGADCIRPCQQMYFFDMPEFDGQIVAVKRGGAVVATINDDDMLEAGEQDDDTRAQAIEFPLKVSVITRDPAADYNPMPQTSSRYSSTVKALGETQVASPIPFGADEGARRADIIHKALWAGAEGSSEFDLPEEWTRLIPSDCYERGGKRWMVTKADYADGAVHIKAIYDRASNYTSTATGISASPPVLPDAGLRGPTVLAVMNLPPLREQDNVSGAYMAVTGTFTGWDGCTVQMSVDGGATFRTVATISNRSVMGRITAEVGPSAEPIPVTLDNGDLYDSTSAELDLGSNAFALVPTAGQSEIGQFRTAVEGEPGEYALTNTRRGVKGTDAATHVSGDRFVMLAGALFLPIDSSLYGSTLYFRAVTNGTAAENNQAIPFLFEAPPATADYRITEAGDYRITEAGDRRILE